jgi:RNA polymerase sigma factor (sigma-70 family)
MAGPFPHETLEALVRQYARLIRTVAARVGGAAGRELEDDISQGVFLSLWKRVSREQAIDFPASYVYTCAVHETLRVVRRVRERAERDEGIEVDLPDSLNSPKAVASRVELTEALEAALAAMAADRRRAVRARLAGFDVDDVMVMYGWSYQKARNLIARGMSDLRAGLRARGIEG